MKKRLLLVLAVLTLLAGCSLLQPTPASQPTLAPTAAPPLESGTATPAARYTPTPWPIINAPDWFDNAILYEIFVRSFYDTNEDGIGDLNGVAARLGYLRDLSVSAVWLMPIHPSPSYHGYDVTDYFAVNPDYGTLEEMIALVDAAHEAGIRVIIDLVVNHMADDHPIFQDAYGNLESEYADWFIWLNDDHTSYQAFGGFRDMPELNYDNPEVLAYVMDIVRFWMDLDGDGDYTDGVDGFRCDVAKDVPLAAWQLIKQEMTTLNTEVLLLGEVWERNAQEMIQWYTDAFDALFDFPLYHTLANSNDENLDSMLSGAQPPDFVDAIVLGEAKLFPAGHQIVRFINNHDTNRVMSQVGGDWVRAKLAATLYLTLPGTPMIYYGEEIGMLGSKGEGSPYWDEFRREPMDWYLSGVGEGMTFWFQPEDRYNVPDDDISVEDEDGVDGSLLGHYRTLTGLRRAHHALRVGAFAKVEVTGGDWVYAFTRHIPPADSGPEEWFLVILNFGEQAQAPTLALDPAFEGSFAVTDLLTGQAWPNKVSGEAYSVKVPPLTGLVLQLTRP